MIAPIDPQEDFPGDDPDEEFEVDPSPEIIRKRAKAISQSWSERTRQRRRVAAASTWRIPIIHVITLETALRQSSKQRTR